MIEMKEIGRRFGASWILSHVNLTIAQGESVALFGNNGSGKSTLLKIIATMLAPTTGTLRVAGYDPQKEKKEIRKRLRYLAHEKQLYESLTVMENLKLSATLREKEKDPGLEMTLKRMGILSYKNQKTSELSEGTRKRLILAKLLVGETDLILLDEPHPTLDKGGKEILNDLIREWRKNGKTIVLASHDHDQALAHADRLVILEGGTVNYDGKPK